MARETPHPNLKYGSARKVNLFTCMEGHIHLIGQDADGANEYEIVLGEQQFTKMREALDLVNPPSVVPFRRP